MKKFLLATVILFVVFLLLVLAAGMHMESVRMQEWARADPEGYAQAMQERSSENMEKEVEKLVERRLDAEREQWEREREEAERAAEEAEKEAMEPQWRLKSKDGKLIAVAASKAVYDRYVDFAMAGDSVGMFSLKYDGLVYMVPSGTPVVRIGGFDTAEVRIMEGEHFGKLGWTDGSFVQSK